MKYHRLIFKTNEEGECVFTEVLDMEMNEEDFGKMVWDKPIIRHIVDGHTHFISLDRSYLEAMLLGISTYQQVNSRTIL